MPVEDSPVHPSTKIGLDYRYGCWNRKPFKATYPAIVRKYSDDMRKLLGFQVVDVEHRLTTDCRYDLSAADPYCNSCQLARKKETL